VTTAEASHEQSVVDRPEAALDRRWNLLIDGELVPALGGRYVESLDPSTELAAARVPDAGPDDVSRAVDAAQVASRTWRRMAPRDRARLVRELGAAVRAHAEELAFLDALDGGFPISNMRNDVGWATELVELFADLSMALGGDTVPASAEHLHYTVREPFGVVSRIVPFNHPLFFAIGKVAAPLCASVSSLPTCCPGVC